jgi:tetratricopeptide (TPR) repeat protein
VSKFSAGRSPALPPGEQPARPGLGHGAARVGRTPGGFFYPPKRRRWRGSRGGAKVADCDLTSLSTRPLESFCYVLRENAAPGNDAEAALAEPVDLPLDRKREILAREALLSADHFAVLGVKPGATREEVRVAYYEASRVFHPDRYFGKKLGSYAGRLDRIFKRLSEAHATLLDDVKLDAYLRANPRLRAAAAAAAPVKPPTTADDAARQVERRARLARHPYLVREAQAKTLVEEAKSQLQSGAPERALGLLHKAARLDPRQKAATAVRDAAQAQTRVERSAAELERARQAVAFGDTATAAAAFESALSFDPNCHAAALEGASVLFRAGDAAQARPLAQKAVDLRPQDVPSLVLLGNICHLLGMTKVARRHLEMVLKQDPDHAAAKQLLKKLRWG